MRVLITGASTTIASSFVEKVQRFDPAADIVSLGRHPKCQLKVDLSDIEAVDAVAGEFATIDRFFLCHGLLQPRTLLQQTAANAAESLAVNLLSTVRLIEHALAINPAARIVVVGSESGYKGSFDDSYALSKAAINAYVRWRSLPHQSQQLVCLAPSMIIDAGMTTRRSDLDVVRQRAATHPKGRLLTAAEVAETAFYLLFQDGGYISNTVISMDGGKFTPSPTAR
jgi:NAD(P)-dependent dehydrogenase (short-subunit alcohol dehydrogenase family)